MKSNYLILLFISGIFIVSCSIEQNVREHVDMDTLQFIPEDTALEYVTRKISKASRKGILLRTLKPTGEEKVVISKRLDGTTEMNWVRIEDWFESVFKYNEVAISLFKSSDSSKYFLEVTSLDTASLFIPSSRKNRNRFKFDNRETLIKVLEALISLGAKIDS